MVRITYILFLLGLQYISLYGQINTDKQLASQYFQNQEYDKAVVLYEKLFKQSNLPFYYNFYLESLLKTGNYKQAEKMVKKEIKVRKEKANYLADLGFVYKSFGELSKSHQYYEKAIKTLTANRQNVVSLANNFLRRGESDFAVQTYAKGRKIIPGDLFYMEMANVYARMGNTQKMTEQYLDFLLIAPARKIQIQGILQNHLFTGFDESKHGPFKTAIIKRVQKYPGKIVYSELLIWFYIQISDYGSALISAKSIDKRLNEDGGRLFELGNICEASQDYNTAILCYEYVIKKGDAYYYYIKSKLQLLRTLKEKLVRTDYAKSDLLDLEKLYLATLQELGRSSKTIPIIRDLARLYAFYLDNIIEATHLLQDAIKTPGIKQNEAAGCKLELADILLFKGETWEASLYYSQIDKAFKHDPIGHEAKYRNAKLFYYQGQFNWAKAKLDILKASTSKLIANDALNLSLLINDNTTIDTNTNPLFLYATAELMLFQNKPNKALTILDSLLEQYPSHGLSDEVLFKKAEIFKKQRKFLESAQLFEAIVSDYSYDILADNALYELASLYDIQLGDKSKAMELYQELLTNFPGSTFSLYARQKFRKLRGDGVN